MPALPSTHSLHSLLETDAELAAKLVKEKK